MHRVVPTFLFTVLSASAQFNFDYSAPIINYRGVMNAASLTPPGLSGSEVAQGSIFSIIGQQLGPATSVLAGTFPLSTDLAGVSVSVIQGNTSVHAFPVMVSANMVNAIMPSNAPLGQVSVTVTYNADASNRATATVTASSFGILAVNGAGYGPGVLSNYVADDNQPQNSLVQTAIPGQMVTLQGTGLGAVSDDSVVPTPGNLSTPVEIFVGGQLASMLYAGRSSCCAGMDEVVFTVPDDVPLGCYVPVQIRTAGTTLSNAVTMSISADGSPCSDAGNPVAALFAAGGNVGAAILSRTMLRTDVDVSQPADSSVDQALIAFVAARGNAQFFNSAMSAPPPGTCTMYSVAGRNLTLNIPSSFGGLGNGLDAGPAIAIAGTSKVSLNRSPLLPLYADYLGTDDPYFGDSTLVFNTAAPTLISAAGGTDVGAFQVAVPPAVQVNWLNRLQISVIDRSQPLTVTWSRDGLPNTAIAIGASNYDLLTNTTRTFTCTADPTAGSFDIPTYILAALLPSSPAFGQSYGVLGLSAVPAQGLTTFTASGLDTGKAIQTFTSAKTVLFQ
jgi:uncharacterized protein (TIGR03437 family)